MCVSEVLEDCMAEWESYKQKFKGGEVLAQLSDAHQQLHKENKHYSHTCSDQREFILNKKLLDMDTRNVRQVPEWSCV